MITITPENLFGRNPRQLQAWNDSWRYQYLLYGGAAGGGKSFFLRWWCVFYLFVLFHRFKVSRAQVILACEDYPTLIDRQIGKIQAEFPPDLGKLSLGNVTRDFTLNEKYGAGKILLRNLDDPSKYLSSEFAGVAVDELTRNKEQVFHDLRLRMRWPGLDAPRFVAGTNPGGIGHGWVKRLWVDRDLPVELGPKAHEFGFVSAKAQDNPFLSPSYYEDLKTLPEAMRKAYAEGRWDLFKGQYFTNFGEGNLIRPEEIPSQEWWNRWISVDWGFEHPFAVYWHTTDGKTTWTYREWTDNHKGPRELAKGIAELSGDEEIEAIYLSPDAFAKRTTEDSIAEQMRQELSARGLPFPQHADDDRIGGWMLMYQMLDKGEWVIGENCKELIRCLPSLVRDEAKVEDIAKAPGDDPADAARYGLKSRLGAARKPFEERVKERMTQFDEANKAIGRAPVTDMTNLAIMSQRAIIEERKKNRPAPVFKPRYARRWR